MKSSSKCPLPEDYRGTEMVCGFLFSPDRDAVVLIQKQRPEWAKGLWNGVGGRILPFVTGKPKETPVEAMCREFEEETGLYIKAWRRYASLCFSDCTIVHFFETVDEQFSQVRTITDEEVKVCKLIGFDDLTLVKSLRWLIPLALDHRRNAIIYA
jgi:8-oxo-dGTP diphosphatase